MFKRITFLALTSLALVGCGCEDFRDPVKIDRDLKPMLDLYLMHAPNDGHLDDLRVMKFSTDFHTGKAEQAGECELYKRTVPGAGNLLWTDRIIRVIRDGEFSFTWKKIVLHELGHCLHNLEHSDNPDDIMFEGLGHEEEWYRDHLIERLDAMFK